MKKILALLFLLPVFAQSQTCVISGNISDYSTAGLKWTVTLKEVRRAGYIMPVRDVPVLVANNGAFKFSVPQTVGTDTTKVRIFISDSRYEGEGKQGVWFAVPHGATATLATLVPVTFIAPSHVIAVPIATIVDSSGGSYATDSIRLGSGLRAIAPTNGGGTPTIIATATGGATDTTGYFARYGGVMAESDPFIDDSLNAKVVRANPKMIPFTPLAIAPAFAEGRLFYDTTSHTLAYYNDESEVTMNIGRENWIRARNTGATITNGQAVYVSGGTGQLPNIALAQANDTVKHCVIGIATHDIEANSIGYITTHGEVRGLNTSNYGDGTEVFLSVDSAGLYTLNKPIFPNPVIRIGVITHSNPANGTLLVSVTHEPDTTGQNNASILTAIRATDVTHSNQIAGKAGADSVATQIALLKNMIAGLADGDSISVQITLIKNIIAGLQEADSTLIKISLSLDSAFTAGARSISSNGRIVSLQDSVTLTVAPNETINLANGNNFRLTLTASDTLGFTGGVDGQVFQVIVTNAGTHTLSWAGVAWPGGTAPVLTAVANKRSIFSFIQSGSMIHGVSVLNY